MDWWHDTDTSILACLRETGPLSPSELGERVGISEGEATAFVCMLAAQGKVRIRLAELGDEQTAAMEHDLQLAGSVTTRR